MTIDALMKDVDMTKYNTKTFVIAEVGSNFSSLRDCIDSIKSAKDCGADAAKFQYFSYYEMYGYGDMTHNLPIDWLPKLKEAADGFGIEFMCTTFSKASLEDMDKYVVRHKIASSDLSYPQLLSAAKACRKPVILSSGGSNINEMSGALSLLDRRKVTLMYCISAYPSKNVNLFSIDKLRWQFNIPIGYSCHTAEWYTPVAAVRYHKASVIEKHFKLREMNTPDSKHSIIPDEFRKMVKAIRCEADFIEFPDSQEHEMLTKHNRRLVAIKNIAKGARLIYGDNFGTYRSLKEDLKGLSGFLFKEVNGKISKNDLRIGEAITLNSF